MTVTASKFSLEGGVITGRGTFVFTTSFWWTGGSMASDAITELLGNTVIETLGRDVRLRERTILNYGSIDWFGLDSILIFDGARITNDGALGQGHFVIWNDAAITQDPNSIIGSLAIRNNGSLSKGITEAMGTTNIEMIVRNEGGTVQFDGNVAIKGAFAQSAGTTTITGDLRVSQYPGFAAATGNFTMDNGTSVVRGSLTANQVLFTNSELHLEAGTVTSTQALVVQADAKLTGSGSIVANVTNRGDINIGTTTVVGLLSITGNLVNWSNIGIKIAGNRAGQFDRLQVSGNVSFMSSDAPALRPVLTINLIGGYLPPEAGLRFTVLSYGSRTDDQRFFDVRGTNIGNGLSFDPKYEINALVLETKAN